MSKRTELLLVRGLPGSGKSTYAKEMKGYIHLEADMYFMLNGRYIFNKEQLPEAHAWCISETKRHLKKGNCVVVSNTFSTLYEMDPYFNLATELDIHLDVVVCRGEFNTIHGVPEEIVNKMRDRWEKYFAETEYLPAFGRKISK